jgi:AraC family transcriptional regulator
MHQDNIYLQRINLVINYIQQNLSDPLPLLTLADIAHFSPFHFHRIFKSVVGETLADFTLRLRLERAALLLKTTPNLPITEAAFSCGFESASHFSRAFKKQFGISPRSWDRHTPLKNSNNGQVLEGFPLYTVDSLQEMDEASQFEVSLRSMPAQKLAYIRVLNPYGSVQVLTAYNHLIDWFRGRGRNLESTTLFGMSQDDPEITPLERCRFDWCLTVPNDWQGEGEVNITQFPACKIACIHFESDIFQEDRIWQYFYNYWLPNSRYQPDNLPAMEIYGQQPAEIGWEQYNMDCAVPIIAL